MGFLNNVGKWFEDREQDVENTFKWGVGQGVDVIKNTEDSVTNIISFPLILIAGDYSVGRLARQSLRRRVLRIANT